MQNTTVELDTNKGKIKIELFVNQAPKTCANFVQYVKDGHFNGTIFHRVIANFMIQGGGFDANMSQKPCREGIENEANNGLSNKIGAVAMARTPDPHSASAQFFINTKDNTFLDFKDPTANGYGYCVFGEVIEGMDVVRAIEKVATGNKMGHQDVPLQTVLINSASIV